VNAVTVAVSGVQNATSTVFETAPLDTPSDLQDVAGVDGSGGNSREFADDNALNPIELQSIVFIFQSCHGAPDPKGEQVDSTDLTATLYTQQMKGGLTGRLRRTSTSTRNRSAH